LEERLLYITFVLSFSVELLSETLLIRITIIIRRRRRRRRRRKEEEI
jgi:hypothetical protein